VKRCVRAWPVALLLLGGCGMYGPLFLEEQETPVPEITEAPPIAVDESADGEPEAAPERDDEEDPDGAS
jgi:hypothetical protein